MCGEETPTRAALARLVRLADRHEPPHMLEQLSYVSACSTPLEGRNRFEHLQIGVLTAFLNITSMFRKTKCVRVKKKTEDKNDRVGLGSG